MNENEFYSINTLPLNEKEKKQVLEYLAHVIWKVLIDLNIQDGSGKLYDPLVIDGNTAHSYVFNFDDGGRHHSFRDLEHLEEMLIAELKTNLREWKDGEFD